MGERVIDSYRQTWSIRDSANPSFKMFTSRKESRVRSISLTFLFVVIHQREGGQRWRMSWHRGGEAQRCGRGEERGEERGEGCLPFLLLPAAWFDRLLVSELGLWNELTPLLDFIDKILEC